jgi:hypothetical protein
MDTKAAVPNVPGQLAEAIARHNCVLFAGGVSRANIDIDGSTREQYLPGWPDLLIVLIDRAAKLQHLSSGEASRLRRAVKDKKFLFAAEAVKKRMGPREFDDALEITFRNPALRATRRHHLITQIPFGAIVTTNYDKLLETAYAQCGTIPPVYSYDNAPDVISALSSNRFFILKAPGDIDRKDTIVLSEQDYRDMIYRRPGFKAALNTIFISKTVLFLGTSLHDVDVNLVLEAVTEAFSAKGTRHFALIPSGDIGQEETQHWREFFGIQLLAYKASKGHPEVDIFLERLSAGTASIPV